MEKQAVKGSNEAIVLRTGEGKKFKDKLCYGGGSGGGGGSADAELLSSWPPRHYTCSFCKRRFKSAQALGGHMNVHRRARAMLRSQSISPISSPPSFPWFPNSKAAADHPFQHDDHHFIYPNSIPNPHWPLYTPHHIINPSPSNLSHLCSLVTITHKNSSMLPAACNCMHVLKAGRYHHAEFRTRERVKKNCIRSDNQLNELGNRSTRWVRQDDMVSGLSLGTEPNTSRPAAEEDIDLELRIGY